MKLKPGDVIFRQGEVGDTAYLIEKGQVEVFHFKMPDDDSHIAVLGEGEIFGEMALIDSSVRSASTRAKTDCELLVIKKDQLLERLDASDSVVQMMMRLLMRRLVQRTQQVSGLPQPPVENHLHDKHAIDSIRLESQIFEAFENNEFEIYQQPIIDLVTHRIAGSEALLRWVSPTMGVIAPGKFIDVLEASSMIVPIGYWIFEECFRQDKKLREQDLKYDGAISINVSVRQLLSAGFVSHLKTLVNKHSVDPANFKIEVTERILMEGGVVIDVLTDCRTMGFQISLDDFGTGFSSLQYLSKMPLDYIKIDRSFVMNVLKDTKVKAVVRSILFLAQQLNLKVIAEGIETDLEAAEMRKLGSELAQGYLYSRPLEFSNYLKFVASVAQKVAA